MTLIRNIAAFCKKNSLLANNDKIVSGVSGGADSLCLLHVLNRLRAEFNLTLTVAHLNHGLREVEAKADEDFVRDIATSWGLSIVTKTVNVADIASQRKQSIEETARQVRYTFLWQTAEQVGANKIAVGHNSNDQTETVLMHFLRGSGLGGLRGMLPQTDISRFQLNLDYIPHISKQPPSLIRPLLQTSRAEIEQYCQTHNLTPRQDSSNQDRRFFRNRLRHDLIPYLESYNPNIRHIIERTANLIVAEVEFLDEHINKVWAEVVTNLVEGKIEVDLADWLKLPLSVKRSILRRAVQTLRHNLRDISFEHIEAAIAVLEKGRTGSESTLPGGLMLTVGYNNFTITATDSTPDSDSPHLIDNQPLSLNIPGLTKLPHTNWQIKANLLPASKLTQKQIKQAARWEAYLNADIASSSLILRPRQPGDIFCPLGLGGQSKKINRFMINEKIPADIRGMIPLLVNSSNMVLWICGYRLDERAALKPETNQILRLKFEKTL